MMILDNYKKLRLEMLKVLLLLTTIFLFVFFLQDLYYGHVYIYVVEFLIACLGLIFYINFDTWSTTKRMDQYIVGFSNTTFCLLLYALILDGFESFTIIWLIAIPIVAYMLNGLQVGQKLTLFYLGLALIILSAKVTLNPNQISLENLLDVFFATTIMWVLAHFYESVNQLGRQQLIEMATTDSLTKLNNRHAFYDYFNRYKHTKVGVIILDLDFFKSVNDHYGHDAGDYVLTEVARILMSYQGEGIKAFRMGGEEFSILTSDLGYGELCAIAKEILVDIREYEYVHEGRILELTASMGVEISETTPSSLNELMKMADRKLYEAKETGRNRVICELTLECS